MKLANNCFTRLKLFTSQYLKPAIITTIVLKHDKAFLMINFYNFTYHIVSFS